MAVRAYADAHLQEAYEPALARFYMWAQTDATVFLAVHIPTGAAMHRLTHVDICVRAYSTLSWLVRAHCCGLRSNPPIPPKCAHVSIALSVSKQIQVLALQVPSYQQFADASCPVMLPTLTDMAMWDQALCT